MNRVRRYLREIHEALTQTVTDSVELMNVAMILREAGWRGVGDGSISADVRALVEAWADEQRKAAT